jgi:hypothetical protein
VGAEPLIAPVAVVPGTEAAQVGAVEYQANVLRGSARPKRVLPAVLGDRGQSAGVPQSPAQRRSHVPPGGKVVALRGVHVHVPAVHGDDAGHLELPSRDDRGGAGGNGPVSVDDIGAPFRGLGHNGPVLGLHVVGHYHDAGEAAKPADPALGHPAIGQIGRQLEREADDPHSVEQVRSRE